MKTFIFPPNSGNFLHLEGLKILAKQPMILYTERMDIDRKTPLTGKELHDMIARDQEAVASAACEGIYYTDEEEALFQEMNRQGLSYDEQARRIDEFLHQKYGIPPDPST